MIGMTDVRAEETNAYSHIVIGIVNCQASISNYQPTHKGSGLGLKGLTSEMGASVLTTMAPGSHLVIINIVSFITGTINLKIKRL